MAPQRRASDRRPWVEPSNIIAGLVLAAAGAIGSRFMFQGDSVVGLNTRAEVASDFRDEQIRSLHAEIADVRNELRGRCK